MAIKKTVCTTEALLIAAAIAAVTALPAVVPQNPGPSFSVPGQSWLLQDIVTSLGAAALAITMSSMLGNQKRAQRMLERKRQKEKEAGLCGECSDDGSDGGSSAEETETPDDLLEPIPETTSSADDAKSPEKRHLSSWQEDMRKSRQGVKKSSSPTTSLSPSHGLAEASSNWRADIKTASPAPLPPPSKSKKLAASPSPGLSAGGSRLLQLLKEEQRAKQISM